MVMMIVALSRQKSVGIHNQFLFPTRQLYHFRDSGLWLEDYHLQHELEMLMVMMIVAVARTFWYTQPVPTGQLYHFRGSGLWFDDYHLQCELEMLMVMMTVVLARTFW